MLDKRRHIVCSAVDIGCNALLATIEWHHWGCYVIIRCRACAVQRLYSTARIAVLTHFLNVKCLNRTGNECSRRGTTNQSESHNHDIMHAVRHLMMAVEGLMGNMEWDRDTYASSRRPLDYRRHTRKKELWRGVEHSFLFSQVCIQGASNKNTRNGVCSAFNIQKPSPTMLTCSRMASSCADPPLPRTRNGTYPLPAGCKWVPKHTFLSRAIRASTDHRNPTPPSPHTHVPLRDVVEERWAEALHGRIVGKQSLKTPAPECTFQLKVSPEAGLVVHYKTQLPTLQRPVA